MLDTYAGLILPLIASATGTLLFRQFFMTIPDEIAEASKIDGAVRSSFSRILAAAVDHDHRGTVRDPVHLWLESISVAAADHHAGLSMQTIVTGIKKMLTTTTNWRNGSWRWHRHPRDATAVAVVVFMQRCSCAAWSRRRNEADGE